MKQTEQSPLILVVDDEEGVRELIVRILEFRNYRTIEAPDGKIAIKKALETSPNLILLDIVMPWLSGYEICKQLKQMETTKNIPIAFITSRGEESSMKQSLALGAVAYWLKPFTPKELLQNVETLFRGIRLGIYEEE